MGLEWERLNDLNPMVYYTKVPGGWFIHIVGISAFFYPDKNHKWDQRSLP